MKQRPQAFATPLLKVLVTAAAAVEVNDLRPPCAKEPRGVTAARRRSP